MNDAITPSVKQDEYGVYWMRTRNGNKLGAYTVASTLTLEALSSPPGQTPKRLLLHIHQGDLTALLRAMGWTVEPPTIAPTE